MFLKIKNRMDSQLADYALSLNRCYSLNKISPLLSKNIKDFIRRPGKRIRPVLFIIGYLGFAKKAAPGLYRSAVALEVFHDFMLVHDDIIDKSDTRRGKPSMHAALNRYLARYKNNIKFDGQDLGIVAGDVMYALAIHAFLSVKEDMRRKEAALKKLIEAAIYTGSGEFIELILGLEDIAEIDKKDIYKIYDLKTANYTFASPLAIGAILAGAKNKEVEKLFNYGIYLGRAFQIKDDILGMFEDEAKTGKPNLTDLKEAKKTILIWYAYRSANKRGKAAIKRILAKKGVDNKDLLRMREIVRQTGALDYAKGEINTLMQKAFALNKSSGMQEKYKQPLDTAARKMLAL